MAKINKQNKIEREAGYIISHLEDSSAYMNKINLTTIIDLADKYCKMPNENEIKMEDCNTEAIKIELSKNFGYIESEGEYDRMGMWFFTHLYEAMNQKLDIPAEPTKPKSREYKFSFFVNTDKNVDLKDIFRIIDDGKPVELIPEVLDDIYKNTKEFI